MLKGTLYQAICEILHEKIKYLMAESKLNIYKAIVRLVMAYIADSCVHTIRAKEMTHTAEINKLKSILRKLR